MPLHMAVFACLEDFSLLQCYTEATDRGVVSCRRACCNYCRDWSRPETSAAHQNCACLWFTSGVRCVFAVLHGCIRR